MKIKVRLRRKIPLEHILFSIALFCVATYALLEHVSIPIPAYSSLKFPLLYLGGICVLTQLWRILRVLLKRKYFYVLLAMVAFCLSCFASAYFNKSPSIGSDPTKYTLRFLLYVVELFCLIVWSVETGRCRTVINFLFFYLLFVTIATDVLMFTGLITFGSNGYTYFLVGTKFIVVYFHFNLLILWLVRSAEQQRPNSLMLVLGLLLIGFISVYVDCMTGILGCLLMLLMMGSMKRKRRSLLKLTSPVLLVIAMTVSVLFPFLAGAFVSIPFVRNFLLEIFNRSANLTGRLNIYTEFADAMGTHWLWGFGVGNANTVASRLFGYANAQNGLLQWVLQIGTPGAVLLVVFVAVIFGRLHKSDATARSMPLVCLIYMYIILGMIETTYSMSFLLWVALLFMLSAENREVQPLMARSAGE